MQWAAVSTVRLPTRVTVHRAPLRVPAQEVEPPTTMNPTEGCPEWGVPSVIAACRSPAGSATPSGPHAGPSSTHRHTAAQKVVACRMFT